MNVNKVYGEPLGKV